MPSKQFAASVLRKLRVGGIAETAKECAKITGKPWLVHFGDICFCGLRYGAGRLDYSLFRFYELSDRRRDSYLTRGRNNKLVRKLNGTDYDRLFGDKNAFNRRFSDYLRRDWLDLNRATEADFAAFAAKHARMIGKPSDGTCGKNVEVFCVKDFSSAAEMLCEIKRKGMDLCEEYAEQCAEMAAFHPPSVNTIRVTTIEHGGAVHIPFAAVRIGADGRCVDNINSGGMSALIDLETGRIKTPACDKNGNMYERHPTTGALILGAQIPKWDEIVALCKRAALAEPGIRYAGWDVCVGRDELMLIEGNAYPGHDIVQMPGQIEAGQGYWPLFRACAGI